MSQANLGNITAGLQTCFAFETITVSTTAVKLTEGTYTNADGKAQRVVITIEGAQVRWRYDGTNPTSSVGHLSNPFDSIILMTASNIKNLRLIRAGGTDATISVSYEH